MGKIGAKTEPKKSEKLNAEQEKTVPAGNKWEELFRMAERRKGRVDRNADEIEFEKNKDVFTFRPNPHKM